MKALRKITYIVTLFLFFHMLFSSLSLALINIFEVKLTKDSFFIVVNALGFIGSTLAYFFMKEIKWYALFLLIILMLPIFHFSTNLFEVNFVDGKEMTDQW